MADVFLSLLHRSVNAGWLVLAVIGVRLLFKRAPKWLSPLLWGIVGLLLLLPFSVESVLSLLPDTGTAAAGIVGTWPKGAASVQIPAVSPAVGAVGAANAVQTASGGGLLPVFAGVWLAGMAAMLLYMAGSYLLLYRRIADAVRLRDNIWESSRIRSPFVIGVFRPRILLPAALHEEDHAYVLAHEQAHIRRRDHWIKPIGFLLLAVYWFNPLLWAAYVLLCRDIEFACDERVVSALRPSQRADYSQTLLNCGAERRRISACPVAFGEVGVRERVRSVLCYKKPAFWVIVLALVVCTVLAVCFLTDPVPAVRNAWVREYPEDGVVDAAGLEARSADFAVGASESGLPVFKNPARALRTFRRLYAAELDAVREAYDLPAFSSKSRAAYRQYGWQTQASDEQTQQRYAFVSQFLELYENSFRSGAEEGTPVLPPASDEPFAVAEVIYRIPGLENLTRQDVSCDGMSYRFGAHSFTVQDRNQDELARVENVRWRWESLPWDDAEWDALMLGKGESVRLSSYTMHLYQALDESRCLLYMDGQLWAVYMPMLAGRRVVYTIYRIVPAQSAAAIPSRYTGDAALDEAIASALAEQVRQETRQEPGLGCESAYRVLETVRDASAQSTTVYTLTLWWFYRDYLTMPDVALAEPKGEYRLSCMTFSDAGGAYALSSYQECGVSEQSSGLRRSLPAEAAQWADAWELLAPDMESECRTQSSHREECIVYMGEDAERYTQIIDRYLLEKQAAEQRIKENEQADS